MLDDNKIIDMFFMRNERAITETDKKYGRYCYSIAYNILFSSTESEETVNDTYLGVWNSIPPQKPSVFSAFLGKITRNLSIDRYRKMTAEKRGGGEITIILSELSECVKNNDSTPEKNFEMKQLTETVNLFIASLKKTERKMFICRYWYGDSVKSISKQFGFSESKVKSMLFRTRNKLKAVLEEEGYFL